MAGGALPEQVDQVEEVRQVTPPTQQNTEIQAEIVNYFRSTTNQRCQKLLKINSLCVTSMGAMMLSTCSAVVVAHLPRCCLRIFHHQPLP